MRLSAQLLAAQTRVDELAKELRASADEVERLHEGLQKAERRWQLVHSPQAYLVTLTLTPTLALTLALTLTLSLTPTLTLTLALTLPGLPGRPPGAEGLLRQPRRHAPAMGAWP